MRVKPEKCGDLGLTRIEIVAVLAAVAILLLLLGLLLPTIPQNKSRHDCAFRLRMIGQELRYYSNLHEKRLFGASATCPIPPATDEAFRQMLQGKIAPSWLVCPQDSRTAASNWPGLKPANISYFVNADAAFNDPYSVLAGDRNVAFSPAGAASWNPALGLHGDCGNLVFADGRVERNLSSSLLDMRMRRKESSDSRILTP